MKTKKMKKLYSLLIITACTLTANSQNLINGSFEMTTGNCDINIDNNVFNSLMNNCYAFGTLGSNLDILNSDTISCSYGIAQNGNYFVGIAYNGYKEALSLSLDSNLISGNLYTLSFYNKKDTSWTSNKLEIGYSMDSLSFGTLIDTVPAPNTGWHNVLLSFSPINNSKFITIRVVDSITSWNLIDNFSLITTLGINDNADLTFRTTNYPNPFSESTWIKFPYITKNAYSLQIIDINGTMVKAQQIFGQKIKVNRENMNSGIYFYRIINETDGSVLSGKMIIE